MDILFIYTNVNSTYQELERNLFLTACFKTRRKDCLVFNIGNKAGREKLLHFSYKSQEEKKARQPISVIRRQQIDSSFQSPTQMHSITESKLNPERK